MALTLRTYLRYVVPFTLLAVVALAPIAYVAWKAGAPASLAQARAQVRATWILAGAAIAFQVLLVAGVAPAMRALAAGRPLSQLGTLGAGLRSLVRAFLPWLVAIIGVVLGGLAFVVPGALLLVLVSLTGASEALDRPMPAPIFDSVEIARGQLVRVAVVVAAIVVVNLAIVLLLQTIYVPSPFSKKLPVGRLASVRTFVRLTGIALVALAPLAACMLAARYVSSRSRVTRGAH